MLKFTYVAVATVALLGGAPSLASAESALTDFCSDGGTSHGTDVPTELSNGSNVSGTFQCEDFVVGDVDDESAGDIVDSSDDDDQQADGDDQNSDETALDESDDDQDAGNSDGGGSEGSDDSEDGDD